MEFLSSIHSILRYAILILVLLAIVRSFNGWFGHKEFTPTDKKVGLFALISLHLQLVVGIILYFMSRTVELGLADLSAAMKADDGVLRFWTVEHATIMLVGIALVTIGYSSAKRAELARVKFKRIAIFYTLGLITILMAIPWPFSSIARPWF